jgi:hypothetical protein
VERYVGYILQHQTESGWLGPDDGGGGEGNTYWTGWNTAIALLQVSLLGDAKSLLCDAKRLVGDGKSLLCDAKRSLGDAKRLLGDGKSLLGDAKRLLGDAKRLLGDAKSSLGDAISLLQYAEARGAAGDTSTAAACNLAVLRYVKESYTRMLVTPLASWSQSRWQVSCQTSWHHCTHGVVNQPSCRVLT